MNNTYLAHHGVKGQKWGVRRYQNPDGSYKKGHEGRYDPESNSTPSNASSKKRYSEGTTTEGNKKSNANKLSDEQKKALKIAAGVALGAAATVAAYEVIKNEKLIDVKAKEYLGEDYFNQMVTLVDYSDKYRKLSSEMVESADSFRRNPTIRKNTDEKDIERIVNTRLSVADNYSKTADVYLNEAFKIKSMIDNKSYSEDELKEAKKIVREKVRENNKLLRQK